MDEETSDATIQSESPGPRAPADRGPILNSARACCLPDCRAADVAVVAFWLVCLAVFLAGLWERTMLPMRSKSRADPIYYTGIVMIAVGTLVLLCYFVVRLEQVRAAARTPFGGRTADNSPFHGCMLPYPLQRRGLGAGPATKTRQASRAGDAIKARHTGNHTKSGLNSTQGDADSRGKPAFWKDRRAV